ncbi:MAG TPA: hypothetical protein VLG47_00260, partial [Candidatus Saccharimonadales bacterium]|nr:hypothetical protein [Candidatus Saccharimonadales bacterium]
MAEQQSVFYFDAGVPGESGVRQGRLVELLADLPPDQIDPRYRRYGELLLAADKDFPFKPGDFDVLEPKEHGITREKCIEIGKIAVLAMAQEAGEPVALSRSILRRMYIMGLGIRPQAYTEARFGFTGFKNLAAFKRAVGSPEGFVRNRYKNWSQARWSKAAAEVEAVVGGKPEEPDYRAYADAHPDFPNVDAIIRHAGGVGMLNELRGYPAVIRWGEEEYIEFGVHFIEVNGEDNFLVDAFNILASRQRGPGVSSIFRNFDSWEKYKQQVFDKIAWTQEKIASYRHKVASGDLPARWNELSDEVLLIRGAKMEVINRLAGGLDAREKQNIVINSNFAASLVRYAKEYNVRLLQ